MTHAKPFSMLRAFVGIVLPILVIGGAGFGGYRLYLWKKKPRRKAPLKLVPTVTLMELRKAPVRLRIDGYGTVQAVRHVSLLSQVAGRITRCNELLRTGNLIRKGETLVVIERHDYEAALARANAEIKRIAAELRQLQVNEANLLRDREIQREQLELVLNEKRRTDEAFKKTAGAITVNDRDRTQLAYLVAKKALTATDNALKTIPALVDAAEARREAARTSHSVAARNLARTEIKAPFDALVLESLIEEGQYVNPSMRLCRLADSSAFEIAVTLNSDEILNLGAAPRGLGGKDAAQPEAVVFRTDYGKRFTWKGRVARIEPVDPLTRTVPLIVEVKRPFGKWVPGKHPALDLGAYCRVSLEGLQLQEAITIPDTALREGNKVYLMRDGRLAIRPVKVRYRQPPDTQTAPANGVVGSTPVVIEAVPFGNGKRLEPSILPGDRLVLSPLALPLEGMDVREQVDDVKE